MTNRFLASAAVAASLLFVPSVCSGKAITGATPPETLDVRWHDDVGRAVAGCHVLSYADLLRVSHDSPLRDVCIAARLSWSQGWLPDRGTVNVAPYAIPDGEGADGDLIVEPAQITPRDYNQLHGLPKDQRILLKGTFAFDAMCWKPETERLGIVCSPARHTVFMISGRMYLFPEPR